LMMSLMHCWGWAHQQLSRLLQHRYECCNPTESVVQARQCHSCAAVLLAIAGGPEHSALPACAAVVWAHRRSITCKLFICL
jgi:hypothetical protein